MRPGSNSCLPTEPSGHQNVLATPVHSSSCLQFEPPCPQPCCESGLSNAEDFAGPYKDYKPPGNRIPAVGEQVWGDWPYLPSYLDPMYPLRTQASGPGDNLFNRGPFFKGASETHEEFVNRGVPPPRQFHKYIRHYEEPGMKYDKSITQTDFIPPLPMLPKDKTPCLEEEPPKYWYAPKAEQAKNPHAREYEMRPQEPEVIYIEDEPKRDFSTEHLDNYICYQGTKVFHSLRDKIPKEIFRENLRETHTKCNHEPPSDRVHDPCKHRLHCSGPVPKRTPWLLFPKNYAFRNGVMVLPCKCENETK